MSSHHNNMYDNNNRDNPDGGGPQQGSQASGQDGRRRRRRRRGGRGRGGNNGHGNNGHHSDFQGSSGVDPAIPGGFGGPFVVPFGIPVIVPFGVPSGIPVIIPFGVPFGVPVIVSFGITGGNPVGIPTAHPGLETFHSGFGGYGRGRPVFHNDVHCGFPHGYGAHHDNHASDGGRHDSDATGVSGGSRRGRGRPGDVPGHASNGQGVATSGETTSAGQPNDSEMGGNDTRQLGVGFDATPEKILAQRSKQPEEEENGNTAEGEESHIVAPTQAKVFPLPRISNSMLATMVDDFSFA